MLFHGGAWLLSVGKVPINTHLPTISVLLVKNIASFFGLLSITHVAMSKEATEYFIGWKKEPFIVNSVGYVIWVFLYFKC